jgi:hypothetical protein
MLGKIYNYSDCIFTRYKLTLFNVIIDGPEVKNGQNHLNQIFGPSIIAFWHDSDCFSLLAHWWLDSALQDLDGSNCSNLKVTEITTPFLGHDLGYY